jgi:small subunit ribosomal protein S1
LTEEKQSEAASDPEAIAPDNDRAPERSAAVAVADEPTTADQALDATEETPATASTATEETATAGESAGDVEAIASTEASVESDTPVASDAPVESIAPESESPVDAPEATEAVSAVAEAASPDAADAPVDASAIANEAPADAPAAAVAPTAAESSSSEALSDQDTADAPAAGEDDEPEPVKDLGPEPTTMEELLAEQDSDIKSFKHGDVVEGSVVRIDKDEILVDIGAKSEGVVSNRELYGRHAESQPQLAIGDVVLVYVLQPESQEGHAVLSLRRAGLERKWRSMQEQFEAGVIIEAPVIDHNKGGLIVDCGIRGFVPISQIVDFPRRPQNDQPRDAAQEIAEKLMPFVGRKLRLKILEVNRKANRLILSEKVALYEERREKRDELFSSLQVGQKVTGTVRSIAPFGVFIDLGGIDGLVHKSELSWNKVNNPESGYKVGEEVEAEVIDINHERGRISLSIRRLQPDPWHSTVADFNVGDVIDGTVTKLVNFGAFVRVRDGLEGLIHISELSHQRVAHPGDVVHEGQALKLKIISLDSERHRLGLSLKQAEEAPARPAPEPGQETPVGSAGPAGPRPERRPRPERGYSMSDAVQEPEGGIDNTLAAAFAQVRDQLAASEEARSGSSTGDDAEATAAEPTAAEPEATAATADDAPVAEVETEAAPEATAEPAATAEPEVTTEAATATTADSESETATADDAASPEAVVADDADATSADAATAVEAAPEAEAPDAEAADVVAAPEVEETAEAPAPEAEVAAPEIEAAPEPEAAPETEAEAPEAEVAPAAEADEAETADAPAPAADEAEASSTADEEPAKAKAKGKASDS